MEHSDDSYLNGSDNHIGLCPQCGAVNYTTYDCLCDKCEEIEEEITVNLNKQLN